MFSIFNLSGQDSAPEEPIAQNVNKPNEGAVDSTAGLISSDANTANKEPMVVLDGPLGHLYTKALNLAYAKEDTGTMSLAYQSYRSKVKETDDIDSNGTYVYVADGSRLTQADVVGATSDIQMAVSSGIFRHHILVLEHRDVPNPKAELLAQFANDVGMKVIQKRIFSQESMKMALESLGHHFAS